MKKSSQIGKIFMFYHSKVAIMVSYSFFIGPFDKILSLNFDLGFLKVKTYCTIKNQFCRGL
jgi:hypothetical protein